MKRQHIFLPTKAKYIGAAMIVLTAISAILIREMHPNIFLNFIWVKPILKFLLLIGFVIMIVSREKVEDEFIMQCRNRAFVFAFLGGIFHYIVNIFINELGGKPNDSGFVLLCLQLPMYLLFFYHAKRGEIKNLN